MKSQRKKCKKSVHQYGKKVKLDNDEPNESKRWSLRSEHIHENKVKLNNDEPTLFEKIPSEILSIIVQYLTKKSLIAWNGVNKRFYESSIQKLWKQPSSKLYGKAFTQEISHLPIKTLHSKFLIDWYHVRNIKRYLPQTLDEYYRWLYCTGGKLFTNA